MLEKGAQPMKRKQIITVIAVSMLIGFTACGSENENAAQDNKENKQKLKVL